MEVSQDKLVLVGERCVKNRSLREAAQKLSPQYELCFSDTGIEYAGYEEGCDIVMVYDNFTDCVFDKLCAKNCTIIGPQILFTSTSTDPPILVRRKKPVYNNALKDQVVCFTGFTDREQISNLASLVHFMNGTIRKDFSSSVTHVVANHCRGEKYKKAVSFGRPIMQDDWVHQLWARRDSPLVTGTSADMMQFKAPPFLSCEIAFHGFTESELKEMEEIAMTNGGQLCNSTDMECTHLVVDNVQTLPSHIRPSIATVKAEWFWASLQMEVCADERLYIVVQGGDENSPMKVTPSRSRYSLKRSKKRKRYLRENLAALATEGEVTPAGSYKSRRSSADQLTVSSILSTDGTPDSSGCLLDSPSPGKPLKKTPKSPTPEKAKPSAKKLVVSELLQTEINYCNILSNILSIFRDGAENTDQPGGAILSNTDSKIIFGKVPAILEVHEEIMRDLEGLLDNWSEDVPVADIILSKIEQLRQAYPPFVNYYEKTKEKIASCIRSNHRFYAFIKVCERKPECGRQSLPDLMMNIVQRLPRIELLLQQIHKYTDKKSSDYQNLESAQTSLKGVTEHINEDKRIADGRMAMFDIIHDIDNCPPKLLSASRKFIYQIDVDEVTDELVGRGEHLTLFLFTDTLEIVKRRHKASSTPFKSPASKSGAKTSAHRPKSYKHVELFTLTSIKRIIDLTIGNDGGFIDDSGLVFALLCRQVTDSRERLCTFQVQDSESYDKREFMSVLAKNIANCCCRTDSDTFIISRPAADFMVVPLEVTASNKSMTRAVSKFSKRLSRAMTMKGVSSPLKRAVSTMMTPTRRSSLRRADTSSISSAASMWELDVKDSSRRVGHIAEECQGRKNYFLRRLRGLRRNDSRCI
ncbi:protein ECT2-like isoform X2 [Watersipora subatra]|uniref:protein ECT2-like isoform X2 n=1 Tax=Watersipora subatra TaxID=2589382 RepID=UPI00355B7C77